ncbi:MAG: sugar transferase, partial [Acidimicrobiales bacterium]
EESWRMRSGMDGVTNEFLGGHPASAVAIAPSPGPAEAADWSDAASVTWPPSRFGRVGSIAAARWGRLRLRKLVLVAGDLVAVSIAMAMSASLYRVLPAESTAVAARHLIVSLLSLPIWFACLVRARLYSSRYISSRLFEFRRVVNAAGASVMTTAAVAFMLKMYIPRGWLLMTFVLSVIVLTASRDVVRRTFNAQRRRGRRHRSVVIVGANSEGREIASLLEASPDHSYRVRGFVDDDLPPGTPVNGIPVLGGTHSTVAVAREHGVTGVLIAASALGLAESSRLASRLTAADLYVEVCTGVCDVAVERLAVESHGRLTFFHIEPVRLDGWRGAAKRGFDIAIATICLVLTAPVLAIAGLAIKVESRGPIIFRQRRVGMSGAEFQILKLRSMVADAEARITDLLDQNQADGPLFKMRDDPRITRVGRWLRRLSIDEIPQFWNVLRGEMSLVGPRPALPSEVAGWSEQLHDRLSVRPGITGMWQVSGRSDATFEEYTRLDLYYVYNWSLLTDLAMVAKTVPTVLSRRGSC